MLETSTSIEQIKGPERIEDKGLKEFLGDHFKGDDALCGAITSIIVDMLHVVFQSIPCLRFDVKTELARKSNGAENTRVILSKTLVRISQASQQPGDSGESELDPKTSQAIKGSKMLINGIGHDEV